MAVVLASETEVEAGTAPQSRQEVRLSYALGRHQHPSASPGRGPEKTADDSRTFGLCSTLESGEKRLPRTFQPSGGESSISLTRSGRGAGNSSGRRAPTALGEKCRSAYVGIIRKMFNTAGPMP